MFEGLKNAVQDGLEKLTGTNNQKKYPDTRSLLNTPESRNQANETISETKINLDQMKNISHNEFLDIPLENRLAFITKGGKNFDDVKNQKVKNLEFKFLFSGKLNKDLLENTTLGQVLPNEVEEITVSGKKYIRSGFEGEFYTDGGLKRLLILDGTKIEITKFRTKEEINTIKERNAKSFDDFFSKNPNYKGGEYFLIVRESINNGLNNDEILIILTSSYEKIPLLGLESAKKMLNVVKSLKHQGLLDYADAKDSIEDINIVIDLLKKYGSKDLKYSVSEREEGGKKIRDLKVDDSSIEKTPNSLQKVIDVALSQVGIHEKTGAADKYFSEAGFGKMSAAKVPWCAAFINWTLKKSGFKGTGSLAAKSFIKETGFGHVGIKVGDKMVSGNYGNKVGVSKLPSGIIGYALPTENGLKIFKGKDFDRKNIPDGAIVVMGRTKKQKQYA